MQGFGGSGLQVRGVSTLQDHHCRSGQVRSDQGKRGMAVRSDKTISTIIISISSSISSTTSSSTAPAASTAAAAAASEAAVSVAAADCACVDLQGCALLHPLLFNLLRLACDLSETLGWYLRRFSAGYKGLDLILPSARCDDGSLDARQRTAQAVITSHLSEHYPFTTSNGP